MKKDIKNTRAPFLAKLCMILAFMVAAFSGYSQDGRADKEYSEAELDQFVQLAHMLIPIEIAAHEKMLQEVESSGLGLEKYNEIATLHELGLESEVKKEELDLFLAITQKLNAIQSEAETEITKTLNSHNMTLEQFQEIMEAYQLDLSVKRRIDEKMSM